MYEKDIHDYCIADAFRVANGHESRPEYCDQTKQSNLYWLGADMSVKGYHERVGYLFGDTGDIHRAISLKEVS